MTKYILTKLKIFYLSLFIILFSQSIWQEAKAHPMPNTIVKLDILNNSIKGESKVSLIDLESAIGHPVNNFKGEFIKNYFLNHITAISQNKNWNTKIENLELIVEHDPLVGDYKEVMVNFILTPNDTKDLRHFIFKYDAVIHQVITHEIVVFVKYDWSNGVLEETSTEPLGVIKLDVPSGKILPLKVDLEEGSWLRGIGAMFLLGMKHIAEGLDHILFLLTLLLVAPLTVNNNKWSSYQGLKYTLFRFLKISLAFTVGHSITLIVGSFNLIQFPSQYIEILIALSIFISVINCIKPIFYKREVIIASGFGLIHGLAFSMSLSGLELDFSSKLISILGFNLGIEAMQIIIMICFFPLLLLSRLKIYDQIRVFMAVITMMVSSAWIAERTTNKENFVTSYINKVFK